MAKANKQFTYLVSYYTRETLEAVPATKRETEAVPVEASSVTRALAKFKRENPSAAGALIVSVAPDDEARYDVGPVTVDLSEFE